MCSLFFRFQGSEGEEEDDVGGDSGSDVTVSVDPVERYVMGPSQLRMHGYPVPPKALAEQEAQVLAAAAREAGVVEVGGGEEEDLGEPLEGEGQAGEGDGQSTPSWLNCGSDGKQRQTSRRQASHRQ
jgi:hypothetical protein